MSGGGGKTSALYKFHAVSIFQQLPLLLPRNLLRSFVFNLRDGTSIGCSSGMSPASLFFTNILMELCKFLQSKRRHVYLSFPINELWVTQLSYNTHTKRAWYQFEFGLKFMHS